MSKKKRKGKGSRPHSGEKPRIASQTRSFIRRSNMEKEMQNPAALMYTNLISNMPFDDATSWFTNQLKIGAEADKLGLPDPTFHVPMLIYTRCFSQILGSSNHSLIVYCHLLTALTEAIVENACTQGAIAALEDMLADCLNMLHSAAPDKNYLGAAPMLGSVFIGSSDVLARERMCTLWFCLFLSAPEEFGRYILDLLDLVDYFGVPYLNITRSVYDVSPDVRDAIRNALKPFLLPEWTDPQASATTQKHMASLLHYLIQRTREHAIETQFNAQCIAESPSLFDEEWREAMRSDDLAAVKRFFDPGEDCTACLFGLFLLAGRHSIWLTSWMGFAFLCTLLYQTSLRYTIRLFFNQEAAEDGLVARFRPVFDIFNLPRAADDGPADSEQGIMQDLLHLLGLRFFDQSGIETVRTLAEDTFRDCLAVYKPTSDMVGGALAAASFFAAYMQYTTANRLDAVNALVASEFARSNLQRSHDSLQQKADRQQTYADGLTRANVVLENETLKLQKQNEDLRGENAELRHQIEHLLDLLDKADEEEAPPLQEEITFPADISPCTAYVVGGHTEFQTKLRMDIPDLRFLEVDKRFDKKALANADIVFLQAAHISHSMFFTVMGVCKTNNIPVKYLESTSAANAAVQIVQEIQQLQQSREAPSLS